MFKRLGTFVFAAAVSFAAFIISSGYVSAAQQMESASSIEKFLSSKSGTWYDEDGNKVLTITETAINSCPVVGGYQFVGANACGHIIIREKNGTRDLKIMRVGCWDKFLVLDDEVPLQRSKQPMYSESIMGIYLGISKKGVVKKLGVPDQTYPYRNGECFVYRKYGMNLELHGNMVTRITLQRGYPWKLDRSGLTCEDPITTYQQVYHFSRKAYEGAQGGFAYGTDSEYMWFDKFPQQLVMDVYNN